MNKSHSVGTAPRWAVPLFIIPAVLLASALALVGAKTVMASNGNQPAFNLGKSPFIIQTGTETVNNVSGISGDANSYEKNFARVGDGWRRTGDYPNGGQSFEACEDGQVVTLWIYAHNTINTKHNHLNVNNLDFQGTAIAHNARVQVEAATVDQGTYGNRHQATVHLNADNAAAVSDSVQIYCDSQEISLTTEGVQAPRIYTWANAPINRTKHQKAEQVFGAGYTLSNPDQVLGSGSKFGYDGNLPACRYYGAYIEVQFKVQLQQPEETPEETPEEIPDTGFGDGSVNPLYMALVIGAASIGGLGLRLVASRQRR